LEHFSGRRAPAERSEPMSETAQREKAEDQKPHDFTIVINGQQKEVDARELSFDEVVSLAYDGNPPVGENWMFTVTYRRAQGNKPKASLVAGETVTLKEGMIFNVTATDKS
jgi:hypothetical protein